MQYFKHMTNMRNDIKIKRLISKYGLEGYGLYNLVIESVVENITTESPIPELNETCEDIAEFYNGNTAKINEIMAYMINQGLFELSEITGRVLCNKVYKFLEQSQTRSKEIRDLISQYKTVIDRQRPSETKVIEQEQKRTDKEQEQNITEQEQCDIDNSFEIFWNLYDKKVERAACEKKWKKIKPDAYQLIFDHVERYVQSTPDKQFRKHPETYINNKSWNDEIVFTVNKNGVQNVESIEEENKRLFGGLTYQGDK